MVPRVRGRETEARPKEFAQSRAWLVSGKAGTETCVGRECTDKPPLSGKVQGGDPWGLRLGDTAGPRIGQLFQSPLVCRLQTHVEPRGWAPEWAPEWGAAPGDRQTDRRLAACPALLR